MENPGADVPVPCTSDAEEATAVLFEPTEPVPAAVPVPAPPFVEPVTVNPEAVVIGETVNAEDVAVPITADLDSETTDCVAPPMMPDDVAVPVPEA